MNSFINIGQRDNIFSGFKNNIEKAKSTLGALSKNGESIKIAEVKGADEKNWRPIATPKQRKKVMEEFGRISEIASVLGSTPLISSPGPDAVTKVLNDISTNKDTPIQRFRNLKSYGMDDPKQLVTFSGLSYSEVQIQLAKIKEEETEGLYTEAERERINAALRKKRVDIYAELAGISVHDRWNTYGVVLDNTVGGYFKSMIAYGSGGVGKTWDMNASMKKFVVHRKKRTIMLKEDFKKYYGEFAHWDSNSTKPIPTSDWRELRQYDPTKNFEDDDYEFVVLGGSISPVMTYSSIYQHNGKIIVFDDIDKILKNKEGLDVLKGALDGEMKDISWATANTPKDMEGNEVPKTFKFKGRAIFITNLTTEQLRVPELRPLTQSRAEQVNLTMTKQETIDKLQSLVPILELKDAYGVPVEASEVEVQTALDYMVDLQDVIDPGYFNARKLGGLTKLLKIAQGDPTKFRTMAASSVDAPTGNQLPTDYDFNYESIKRK